MSDKKLTTEPYKGVRDFYPQDMAIQRYIFDTWAKTAESFGFERYDASILEPSDLYKAKGAENEELVNEQTYTFIDRGDREVTLRPEMTPTVARMVAGKKRELQFPLRWYSIPNLFRYERPQRGRLREHWQLNCDIFGGDVVAADTELIALAYQTLIDFGATPNMFAILINNRADMTARYQEIGISEEEIITNITRLTDRKNKIRPDEYRAGLLKILNDETLVDKIIELVEDKNGTSPVLEGLRELGITNARIDRTIARGFDYYTGTVFELIDTYPDNNRSMMGGGRYDNLTGMFSNEAVSGIGFGMGDVTMRVFLETHNLLPDRLSKSVAKIAIIPMSSEQNLYAEKVAMRIRQDTKIPTLTDIGTKKFGEKIGKARSHGVEHAIVIGEEEINTGKFILKNLQSEGEFSGNIEEIQQKLIG